MIYNEEQGNLFDLSKDEYVFAHCIAADLQWNGGIAPVLIRKEFDAEDACRYEGDGNGVVDKPLKVGTAMRVKSHKGVFFNLITKAETDDKPTYDDVEKSLLAMKDMLIKEGYDKLAMPRIGCGIDGLQWDEVSEMIQAVFVDTKIEIQIRYM